MTGADCAVLVTEWNELRTLDLRKLGRRMRRPVLCDLRNLYDAGAAVAAGMTYVGVGQGVAPAAAPRPRRKQAAATKRTPRKPVGTKAKRTR